MKSIKLLELKKARKIKGETLIFRDANVSDAEFILTLRSNEKKSRFLSKTSNDIEMQRQWLEAYGDSKDEAYFIIEYKDEKIGTVRLYDPQKDSFCWGSWILVDERPRHAAIESTLMVYEYAAHYLGFNRSHFDVRKGNKRVWKYHEKLGAIRVRETELDYFYELSQEAIQKMLKDYSSFLPNGINVKK